MDQALCGALLSSSSLRTEDGCQPACACSGQPLEQQEEEIEMRHVEIEGKDVVVLFKKS